MQGPWRRSSRTSMYSISGKFLLLLACGFLPIAALAGWTAFGTVSSVYSHDGYYVVRTSLSDNPCGTPGMFWWPATDSDAKDMFAMAMTALVTDKMIAVVHDASTPNCSWNGQLATHIVITNQQT